MTLRPVAVTAIDLQRAARLTAVVGRALPAGVGVRAAGEGPACVLPARGRRACCRRGGRVRGAGVIVWCAGRAPPAGGAGVRAAGGEVGCAVPA